MTTHSLTYDILLQVQKGLTTNDSPRLASVVAMILRTLTTLKRPPVIISFALIFACSGVEPDNDALSISIISPSDGSIHFVGDTVDFECEITDSRGNDTDSYLHLSWESDNDGELDTLRLFKYAILSAANHLITLSVIDRDSTLHELGTIISIAPKGDVAIYVGGSINYKRQGVYWLDGTMNIVSGAAGPINSMQLVGADLYFSADHDDGTASYWKNDLVIHLPAKDIVTVTDLLIDQEYVYATGYDRKDRNEPAIACYWVNGNKSYLSKQYSIAQVISGSGAEIVIGGSENNGPCIWVNGEKTDIVTSYDSSTYVGNPQVVEVIAVPGHIYAVGYDWIVKAGNDYGQTVGWLWHNGTIVVKWPDNISTKLKAAALSEEGIIVVGSRYGRGFYWNKGLEVELRSPNPTETFPTAVQVFNGDIFIGGYYFDDSIPGRVACYWRNGARVDLPGYMAEVHSIAVTSREQ